MPAAKNIQLYSKFQTDMDILARRFISIYNLSYSKDVNNLDSSIMRWLDFRMRYVSSVPRKITYSNKFPIQTLPDEVNEAWEVLAEKIEKGEDINPYQGRGLIKTNDTSGSKKGKRTDLLWASWGILHFHITKNPIQPDSYFSDRSGYQAFCAFDNDTCAVIDIREHPKGEGYSDPGLLHIIADSWPHSLEHAQINGILPGDEPTATEIHKLRNAGVNSIITIKGKSYMNPGIGLTSAGTSLNLQMTHICLNDAIRILADLIELEPVFKSHTTSAGVSDPNFGLTITDKGITLFEEKSRMAFNLDVPTLPRLKLLQEFVFPDWAVHKYMSTSFSENF